MRWVGIDEAGYGPNLGPLVMTAVMAESSGGIREPGDAAAASISGTTWHHGRSRGRRPGTALGRRLEGDLLRRKGAASARDVVPWPQFMPPRQLPAGRSERCSRSSALARLTTWSFRAGSRPGDARDLVRRSMVSPGWKTGSSGSPLVPSDGTWRITGVRTVVVGPARFNRRLEDHGLKSAVHYEAFEQLLRGSGIARPTGFVRKSSATSTADGTTTTPR